MIQDVWSDVRKCWGRDEWDGIVCDSTGQQSQGQVRT